MPIFAELNARLLGRNTWPIPAMAARWDEVELFAALRKSDETRLRQEASVSWRYPYLISPVPRMLSRASANMLYGEPADIRPGNENDEDRMNFIVNENDLASEFVRGAMLTSSEGETYGRVSVQPALLDAPIVEFWSAKRVIPHFAGRFLIGATFVSEWEEGRNDFYRLFETYEAGIITAYLYRGGRTSIGARVELNAYPRTNGVQEVVYTGVARPLCAFIPNSIDDPPDRGFSDYRGLERRFLAINEAVTVGQNNLNVAGRKRMFIDKAYLDEFGRVPKGDDVFIRKSRDAAAGETSKPVDVGEYTFESSATVAWIDHLLDSTLQLAGVAPSMVGRGEETGGAISGTARKLKLAHSLIEASGKGRHFDRGAGWLLRCAALIDSRRTTEGGFGRGWSEPNEPVTIERAPALPRDDQEAAQRIVLLTNANGISTEEKVRAVHPEWDQEQIDEEVAAIENGAVGDPPEAGGSITPPRPAITLPGE